MLKPSTNLRIYVGDNRSTLTITSAMNEHVGYYSCKAINEIGELHTRAKFDITSTAAMNPTTGLQVQPNYVTVGNKQNITNSQLLVNSTLQIQDNILKSPTSQKQLKEEANKNCRQVEEFSSKQTFIETIESNEMKIQNEIHYSVKETTEELVSEVNIEQIKFDPLIDQILERFNAEDFGSGIETIRELAAIDYLMKTGVSISDIKLIYNKNGFSALKRPESQFALVQLVEREGHGKLISQILIEEHVADDELLASTVGFHAFMKMIELKHTTVENVLTHFSREDFYRQEWETVENREVLLE